jgi:hypothetical protein
MVNQLPVTFTASLKVMAMFAVGATPAALLVGVVLETLGALSPGAPHDTAGLALLRGFGAAVVKSLELLSVSVQPLEIRIAAVVFDRTAVAAPSKQLADP